MTARLLVIMGSGETAPPLARVHRAVVERLGPSPVPAVLVDTPYGFQENAEDISGRTMDYFREAVGLPIGVASFRSGAVDDLERATAVARIREARLVFCGPGSPSYALRQWSGSEIPRLFAEKLREGGALVFASAAALTLGRLTVPVYEIYKAGEPPHWLDGLDLLSEIGLPVAVVPHYDNAEGGNHDTRFCYLGERRLEMMERLMPEDAFILGVDGHTALLLDLERGTAEVAGLGGVTVRRQGRSRFLPSGSTCPIVELAEARRRGGRGGNRPTGRSSPDPGQEVAGREADAASPVAAAARLEAEFGAGIEARDIDRAVRALLELDRTLIEWSRDTGSTDDFAAARAVLASLVARLGTLAAQGAKDPRETIGPLVDALLEVRVRARDARDWATADLIRERLTDAGVEVHDAPDGTTWEPRSAGPD